MLDSCLVGNHTTSGYYVCSGYKNKKKTCEYHFGKVSIYLKCILEQGP